jgi:hypothetical protein
LSRPVRNVDLKRRKPLPLESTGISLEILIGRSLFFALKRRASIFSDQRTKLIGKADESVELAFAVFIDFLLGGSHHWWLKGIVQNHSPRGMFDRRMHNIKAT